jgi:hypothetical protein
MSMSTQHGGGSRKPSTKPVAGAKPKQGSDETGAVDDEAVESPVPAEADAAVDDTGLDAGSDADAESDAEVAATKTTPAKRTAAKSAGATTTGRPKASPRKSATPRKTAATGNRPSGGNRPAGKAATRRVAPVKVAQERSWGPIALFGGVAVVALAIIGFAGYQVYQNGLTWQEKADKISGITDFHKTDPKSLEYQQHTYGPIKYKYNPPVGGTHNPNWQRCLGDVYTAPIASEHAVHSEEHGAVWITYNPSLPKDQVEKLAKRVRGNDFMLMSPFTGLDAPISLQTWGYQLKVQNADDKRIDEFIKDLKQKAAYEQGATCSSGNMITATGTTPHDLGKDDPNAQQNMGNDGGANSGQQNTGTDPGLTTGNGAGTGTGTGSGG